MKYLHGLKLLLSIAFTSSPLFSHAAEPIINIDENTSIISIQPQNNNASQTLNALAKELGFELTGTIEMSVTKLNFPLQGSAQKIIEQLTKPQSTIMLFSSDEKGNKYISKVELLPTGNTDSQFLNDGTTLGYQRPEAAPETYQRQQARQERTKRNERRATKQGNKK